MKHMDVMQENLPQNTLRVSIFKKPLHKTMQDFSGTVLPGYFIIFSFGQHFQLFGFWL